MTDQTVLIHHGVKGQKWGVRRTPEQLGHAPRKEHKSKIAIKISKEKPKGQTPPTKPVQKPASTEKKKTTKEMSDDELRRAINRIELERRYSSLTAKQKSKGRKIVEEIIGDSAKAVSKKYTTKAMDKGTEKLLKKLGVIP